MNFCAYNLIVILDGDKYVSDIDDLGYTTILYGTGPGHSVPRTLPSNGTKYIPKHDVIHSSAAPKMWSTHGGEDVPVYAFGKNDRSLLI